MFAKRDNHYPAGPAQVSYTAIFVSEHETTVIQSIFMQGIEQKRFEIISMKEGPTNWHNHIAN